MTQEEKNAGDSGVQTNGGTASGAFGFLTFRLVAGVGVAIVLLWITWTVLGYFEGRKKVSVVEQEIQQAGSHRLSDHESVESPQALSMGRQPSHAGGHEPEGLEESKQVQGAEHAALGEYAERAAITEQGPTQPPATGHGASLDLAHSPEKTLSEAVAPAFEEPKAVGVRLVEATISVLDYELNERFWGWRRNDLIRFTDNVENMQLGILEVVRRTSVSLMERMSRHGPQASIDANLENAMNWLMIKPDKYWLPSAEEKYKASLEELRKYADKLEKGEAHFYVRADTLIPLLLAFADLAGSCDENLVKTREDDGSPVSWFKVDDYFYYAKGVAEAMGKILHAVREDFSAVLEARHAVELINRAIHACHEAAGLNPWIVTDAPLDGILANHRANIAAEMSHVRYFLNALAKALAT